VSVQGDKLVSHPAETRSRGLGARLSVSNLTKLYNDAAAVRDVSFEVAVGELLSILGPSGSGKTTTMLAITGFVSEYSGEICVEGRRVDQLPPNLRGFGVVFQHLELFPHMTVANNIAFPLRMRGVKTDEVRERVQGALDLVRLPSFGQRLPSQLSGGQQQRVALARAIVFAPRLLLLDEPFGALDRKLREEMQAELKSLHQRLGITIIHITHDQAEALAISDRIAVMHEGRLVQIGTPQEIYFKPQSRFVADFVGESLFLAGTVTRSNGTECEVEVAGGMRTFGRALKPLQAGTPVTIMLRPEAVRILDNGQTSRNSFVGRVTNRTFIGDRTKYYLTLPGGHQIGLTVHNRASSSTIPTGTDITVGWDGDDALLMTD
jgi:putative spermidine/putrescine transport system ATP-binding protein